MKTYDQQQDGRHISINVNSDWSGNVLVRLQWTHGQRAAIRSEFTVAADALLRGAYPDIDTDFPLTRSDWGAVVAFAVVCNFRDAVIRAVEELR